MSDHVFGVILTLAICIPIALMFAWIAYLVHASDQNEFVKVGFRLWPRLIPWSAQSRLRKRRAELETIRVEKDIYEARHAKLQKEIVYTDLENERLRRALGSGDEE